MSRRLQNLGLNSSSSCYFFFLSESAFFPTYKLLKPELWLLYFGRVRFYVPIEMKDSNNFFGSKFFIIYPYFVLKNVYNIVLLSNIICRISFSFQSLLTLFIAPQVPPPQECNGHFKMLILHLKQNIQSGNNSKIHWKVFITKFVVRHNSIIFRSKTLKLIHNQSVINNKSHPNYHSLFELKVYENLPTKGNEFKIQ